MKLIVLSLDVSTVSTGWCIYKGGNIYKYGTLKITDKLDIHQRMVIFRDKIEALLVEYKPTVVIVEDVWVGLNPATAKLLAKFCGIAEEASCRFTGKAPIVLENTKVKGFFKCSKKEYLFAFILDILDIAVDDKSFAKDNDYIDAIAQLLCYLHINNKLEIRIDKDYGYLYNFGGKLNG